MVEEEQKVVVSMPLFIEMGKRKIKRYHINLNNYRNWHFQVSDKIKKMYKDLAVENIENEPTIKAKRVAVKYTLYRGDKRDFDLMNILCIHDKFFMDAFVWLDCIPDDNVKNVKDFTFEFGGYDKENPRVDIEITVLEN